MTRPPQLLLILLNALLMSRIALCHRPRLNSKAEIYIVTHLAICASHDWNQVDRIVVGNFITASQAQRKWYTKVISMVFSGDYKLGAVCFFIFFFSHCLNISLVHFRILPISLFKTKQWVNWRKKRCKFMLDWGLGYCIRVQQVEWKAEEVNSFALSFILFSLLIDPFKARRLLKSLSIKQGIKYDAPESAVDIAPFIAFYELNVNEMLDPPSSFSTLLNIFFISFI